MSSRWRCVIGAGATMIALLLAGCGGSSHNSTSAGAAPAPTGPPANVPLPPGASPAARHVFGRVLRAGDLPGLQPQGGRQVGFNASSWVGGEELPQAQRAEVIARLERLGFVAGVRERLTPSAGGPGEAISIVEQFRSVRAAQEELAADAQQLKALGQSEFAVPAIPGARGVGGPGGFNVAFSDGVYYYLVGAGFPPGAPGAPSHATLSAAARRLYLRVHR
jgi:hypothetical protein